MKCDTSRERLIDYVCGELSAADRAAFERHAAACKSCRRQLAELTETRNILRAGADETPPPTDLAFVVTQRRGFRNRFRDWRAQNNRGALALGFACGAAVAALALLLLNLCADYSDGRLTVSVGASRSAEVDSVPVTRRELHSWRQQTYLEVARLIEASETRQRILNQAAFARLLRSVEQQRRFDLQAVGRGLEAFQYSNEQRLRRTQTVLQNLVQASAMRLAPTNKQGQNND